MKNLLTFLLLIISANLFGQVKQEVVKPVDHKFGVYYLDDQSVMFNTNGLVFNGGDIPQLIEIFKTADNLDKFAIKDSMDCIILDKFKELLKKDSSELLK